MTEELPSIFDIQDLVAQDRINNPPVYVFKVGQHVRICKKIEGCWPEIDSWKGQIVTILNRTERGIAFRGDKCYLVEANNGAKEEFKEQELDFRYRRKK